MSTCNGKGLIACCITLALALALALAGCNRGQFEQASIGRYTIVHSPHTQQDIELLDTATGNTWLFVQIEGTDKNPKYGWQFVGKIDQPPYQN